MIRSRYLQPIPRTNLTQEIVQRLVNLIVQEGLRPGDKLPSERELISRFSIGRSSLREALKILSAIGLVEVSLGEGMFVGRGDLSLIARPLTLGLMMGESSRNELIETRRVLEVALAGFAAERATAAEIDEIGSRLETMRTNQARPERYSRADLEFHLAISKAAHNRVLFNLLHTLRHILGALIATTVVDYDANQMPQSYKVHVPIFGAIQARDAVAARQAMAAHLNRLEERLSAAVTRTRARRSEEKARKASAATLTAKRARKASPAAQRRPLAKGLNVEEKQP
jgi:GntR family transcriptional regulator, transcriptional repressor for pyruvate dehydrogenase complex